jgi:UDP-glucose 4-epimerase
MVFPRFVKQALLERPLTVHGDGEQSRVFLDVNDAVTAIRELMNRDDGYGEPYNIGGSESITIKELAERIIEMVGSESEIEFIPYEEAYEEGFEDMRRREPNISKLQDAIGFKQKFTLEDTLERIIEYFRSDETLL